MKWLIADPGVIGTIIGAHLMDAGEDVAFFISSHDKRIFLKEYGIDIISHDGKKRHYKINVAKPDAKPEKARYIIAALRINQFSSELEEAISRFVKDDTVIIPMLVAFDLPRSFYNEFKDNIKIAGFPLGMGGRKKSLNQVISVIPEVSPNIMFGYIDDRYPNELKNILKTVKSCGLETRKSRHPLAYSRIAAAFLLATAIELEGRSLPLENLSSRSSIITGIKREFKRIMKILNRSDRKIPLFLRFTLCGTLLMRNVWITGVLQGFFGDGLERFYEEVSREEISVLEEQLMRIESGGQNK